MIDSLSFFVPNQRLQLPRHTEDYDKSIHIQRFYNQLTSNGFAPKSIRCIHGVISRSLNVALQQELIQKNPAALVTLPRLTQKEIKPLTDEQIALLMAAIREDEYANELMLILFTGLREGECLGITWDCVDFENGELTISKQLQWHRKEDGGCALAPTKSDKVRILTPAPFVMDMLRQQYQKQTKERMAAGPLWKGWQNLKERKTALVFLKPDGTCITPPMLYNHYKKIAKTIGAPDSTVHDLRHTYAVLSLQNGDDVKTLQGNLGHATAAFTLDRYGHVSDRMKQESANRMQAYIERIG